MTPFQELTQETWMSQVAEVSEPVLVDFQAPGVGTFIPNETALQINAIWHKPVRLVYADVSELLEIVLFHRIIELPTLCLFYKGQIRKAWTGPNRVEKMLAAAPELVNIA